MVMVMKPQKTCKGSAGEDFFSVSVPLLPRGYYLINDISECKAALKKVMNLLERHPGSERLHEQVAKIRARWMGK
jgi:hypothetical protein